mmetsp:Transcript_52251/g.104664  ORF Transcript_52251/g.104664 Transcript_52251/m.104664 type:complete len:162 (+) Transcript_52251:138-623(+)
MTAGAQAGLMMRANLVRSLHHHGDRQLLQRRKAPSASTHQLDRNTTNQCGKQQTAEWRHQALQLQRVKRMELPTQAGECHREEVETLLGAARAAKHATVATARFRTMRPPTKQPRCRGLRVCTNCKLNQRHTVTTSEDLQCVFHEKGFRHSTTVLSCGKQQ